MEQLQQQVARRVTALKIFRPFACARHEEATMARQDLHADVKQISDEIETAVRGAKGGFTHSVCIFVLWQSDKNGRASEVRGQSAYQQAHVRSSVDKQLSLVANRCEKLSTMVGAPEDSISLSFSSLPLFRQASRTASSNNNTRLEIDHLRKEAHCQ